MFFPMTDSKTNNINSNIMKKQYYNKSNFRNIRKINIMMYVTINFFVNPDLLKDIILFSQQIMNSQ